MLFESERPTLRSESASNMTTARTERGAFPLILAGEGERLRIAALNDGRGFVFKMTEMGLPVGSELTVVHRDGGGSIVVARNDTRIALGAGMAHRIMVSRVLGDG
jgi:ferrous iron transport protein A